MRPLLFLGGKRMEIKDIKPRALTIDEYEKYLDFIEETDKKVADKKVSLRKSAYELAKWVAKEIYHVEELNCTPGTLFDVLNRTVELTDKSELADEKNSVTSGTGE